MSPKVLIIFLDNTLLRRREGNPPEDQEREGDGGARDLRSEEPHPAVIINTRHFVLIIN